MLDEVIAGAAEQVRQLIRARGEDVNTALLEYAWGVVAESLRRLASPRVPDPHTILLERMQVALTPLVAPERRFTEIMLVNAYRPMDRPVWMPEEIYRDAVRHSLPNYLEDFMSQRVRDELGKGLGIPVNIWMWLGAWTRDLCDAVMRVYRVPASTWPSVRTSLFEAIFALCGYAAAGRKDRVDQLLPLFAEMCNGILLVGEYRGRPEVVILLDFSDLSQPVG